MFGWTTDEIAAAVALAAAMAQLGAAPWRDLGVVTLCAAGVSLAFARGFPSTLGAALLLGALLVAAAAWSRGARRGVGRPGLAGVGVAAMGLGALAPFLVPEPAPPEPRERIVQAAIVLIGLCASVGFSLALERPGPRRARAVLLRRVPIATVETDGRPSPEPSREPDPTADAPRSAP